MLAEAAKSNPPVNYHQLFPNAAQAVVDRTIVPGAFSKAGWTFMQNAFKDPSRFFSGEQWVLGEQGTTGLDPAAIDQLKQRYQNDFIARWREFLKGASRAALWQPEGRFQQAPGSCRVTVPAAGAVFPGLAEHGGRVIRRLRMRSRPRRRWCSPVARISSSAGEIPRICRDS